MLGQLFCCGNLEVFEQGSESQIFLELFSHEHSDQPTKFVDFYEYPTATLHSNDIHSISLPIQNLISPLCEEPALPRCVQTELSNGINDSFATPIKPVLSQVRNDARHRQGRYVNKHFYSWS